MIQPKLKVGEPNDQLEEEADRVAELMENDNDSISPFAVARNRSPVGSLQRLYGTQAVLQMRHGSGGLLALAPSVPLRPSQSGILRRKCACGSSGRAGECKSCSDEPKSLQRRAIGGDALRLTSAPPIVHEVLGSPGQPLDSATRAGMGARFGHSFGRVQVYPRTPALSRSRLTIGPAQDASEREADRFADRAMGTPIGYPGASPSGPERPPVDLSRVRIHADARAAESARAVDAAAYTVGENIVFGAGRYTPGTATGQRLLAHELTHVAQQRAPGSGAVGGGVVQRQPVREENLAQKQGYPLEKWSPEVEALYRKAGQIAQANALRRCRTHGKPDCDMVLTPEEVWTMYLASESDEGEPAKQVPTEAAPAAGALAPQLSGVRPTPTTAPKQVPRPSHARLRHGAPRTAPRVTPGVRPLVPTPTPGPNAVRIGPTAFPASGPGISPTVAGASAAALPVAIFVAGMIDGLAYGRFQTGLIDMGYTLLEHPQRLCQGVYCHGNLRPAPTLPELDLPLEPSPLPRFGEPLTPRQIRDIQEWLEPTPTAPPTPTSGPSPRRRTTPSPYTTPRVQPDTPPREEGRRRGCRTGAGPNLGGNSCHDAFAMSLSGVPREFLLTTPEGVTVSYDAYGRDQVLYEVKTNYGFIFAEGQQWQDRRREVEERFYNQAELQYWVARRCGYPLVWIFNQEAVRKHFNSLIEPPAEFRDFPCNVPNIRDPQP